MKDKLVWKLIEENNLVKITSIDEALFSEGKIHSGFFMYLIIKIEEHYGITFEDEELKIENFDTIRLIESMIKRKTSKSGT